MGKCLLDIKYDIIEKVRKEALKYEGFKQALDQNDMLEITDASKAASTAREINQQFKEDIITPSFTSKNHYYISPSEKLTQQYFDDYKISLEEEAGMLIEDEKERGGYTEEDRGEFFQNEGIPASTASPASIAIIKDFLNRIGVDIQTLKSINVNGIKQDANGVANIMQKLVQVVEGKEATALPEEAMHFAVEIIQQNDPKLFNKLCIFGCSPPITL